MHLLNRLLEAFLLPPFGPLLWIVVGLALIGRRPRFGRAIAWMGVALALVLMTPVTVGMLLGPLESAPVLEPAGVGRHAAIVILGGGRRGYAPEYDGETVNRLTLERLRYGARLARASGLPVLVSGGVASDEFRSEASLMAEALSEDFGVEPRWREERSINTGENARNSAALLKRDGIERIVLVTHAAHMPRAQHYFEAAGLKVVPAPTGFQSAPGFDGDLGAWLPSENAAYAGWYAAHEWAGVLQQRLRALAEGARW